MLFDIVLPSIISVVAIAIVWLYVKFETKIKSLFEEEKELHMRDAVLLVITMGVMVTVIALIPQQAIMVLFLAAYSFILFLFTYIAVEKWYFAVLPPIVFVALYRFSWNIILLNAFALLFAIFVSVYLGGFFSWKTVLVFAALITVMDVIQVFGTGFMVDAANKFIDLKLPVLIIGDTFPRQGKFVLGLGDIFLTGLLAVQATEKYNRKAGAISAVSVGFAFFLFEIIVFHYEEFARVFPATLVVVIGWLLGLGVYSVIRQKIAS